MNFFKRKFSFQEEEGGIPLEDPSPAAPPSAFSFQSIANRVSNTISAPTSPARTGESLAAAVERSLQGSSRAGPAMPHDARVLLVIDNHVVDWCKYFRSDNEPPIRVEQADYPDLDLLCTEHTCLVEVNQPGRDTRVFTPNACFIGPGATKTPLAKTILRALIAANIPFTNSHTSMVAFMDRSNLKKQLRKISLPEGGRIPFLPTLHYPHFRKFHPSTSFPVVVSVNEGFQGIGKMKVNSPEELTDLEGVLRIMGKGDTEVEVEPFVDLKYDLHVQKIGEEYKTFIRRGISRNWKSNVGSAVLEQIPTIERHRQYLRAITEHVGRMHTSSVDILVSREGREFVHSINDVIAFFGESQEEDRRAACTILKEIMYPKRQSISVNSPPTNQIPRGRSTEKVHDARPHERVHETRGIRDSRDNSTDLQRVQETRGIRDSRDNSTDFKRVQEPRGIRDSRENSTDLQRVQEERGRRESRETPSFTDDTMGQLKKTFAGIFGES